MDGSFVSAKPDPGDFDLLFVFDTRSEALVTEDREAKRLLDSAYCRVMFGGDVFSFSAEMVRLYPQFFPLDSYDKIKFTETSKGVLEVEL